MEPNTPIIKYSDDAAKAYKEGFNDGQFTCCHDCATAQNRARNEALDEAAQVADDEECVTTDDVNCNGNYRIADKIRALKTPEGGKRE